MRFGCLAAVLIHSGLFVVSACTLTPKEESLENLPCESEADCVGGYTCDLATMTCVAEAHCIDDDGDHYCGDGDCDDDPTTGADCHTGCEVFYLDNDGDGHGNHNALRRACISPGSEYVGSDDDCDDTSDTGASCSRGCDTYYADSDGDGFGNPGSPALRCELPTSGYVANNTDCDDQVLLCTTDCETDVDGDLIPDCSDTCVDKDGDTYGDGTNGNTGCAQVATDCDDDDSPLCTTDCVTNADGDLIPDCEDLCVDKDGDTYGDGTNGNTGCTQVATDCDDDNSPLCTTDCVTDIDGDLTADCEDFCVDQDGDTYGNGTNGNTDCVGSGIDCDDGDEDEFPTQSWYPDGDGDGSGDSGVTVGNECERASPSDVDNNDDCDDENANCTTDDCTDADKDGYCWEKDCDDWLYACNASCADSDTDGVDDCIEVACGVQDIPNETCIVLDGTTTTLAEGIAYANLTSGRERFYLVYSPDQSSRLDIWGDCVELRGEPGEVITNTNETGGGHHGLFEVHVAGCVFEGLTMKDDADNIGLFSVTFGASTFTDLTITGGANSWVFDVGASSCVFEGLAISGGQTAFRVGGANTEIRNCTISGGQTAFRIGGANTEIRNCTISGGQTAFRVDDAVGTEIVGNLIVNNAVDGIQLLNSTDTVIDQNTIADNEGTAVRMLSGDADDLCMRNNVVASNGSFAFAVSIGATVTFETATCETPLPDGKYGNVVYDNNSGDDQCGGLNCDGGEDCTECMTGSNGFPAATDFWEFSDDPDDNPDFVGNYCLGNASLINVCDNLGYDLNGDDAGSYNGAGPEPGAREAGSGGCSVPQ